jgi:hypothetical protein
VLHHCAKNRSKTLREREDWQGFGTGSVKISNKMQVFNVNRSVAESFARQSTYDEFIFYQQFF